MQLKITLPDGAVEVMDELRGDVSRSLWILRRLESGGGFGGKNLGHAVKAKAPSPSTAGSPEPPEISEPPTGPMCKRCGKVELPGPGFCGPCGVAFEAEEAAAAAAVPKSYSELPWKERLAILEAEKK